MFFCQQHSVLQICVAHSQKPQLITLIVMLYIALYWIFSLVHFSHLTFNICLDLMVELHSCLSFCMVISQRDIDHRICLVDIRYKSIFSLILQAILLIFYRSFFLKACLELLHFHSCLQLSSKDGVQHLIILCKVNTETGLYSMCEEIGVMSTYPRTRLPLEALCDQLFMYQREPRNYI